MFNDSAHAEDLNTTLISVRKTCDDRNTVVYTKINAIIINQPAVKASRSPIVATAQKMQDRRFIWNVRTRFWVPK